MKLALAGRHGIVDSQTLNHVPGRKNPVLKPYGLFGLPWYSCNSRCVKSHSCLLSFVMNTKEDARIGSMNDPPNPTRNRDTSETANTLPVRSPSSVQTRLLAGCMPLHGLRRTASSPRHVCRRVTTTMATASSSHVAPMKSSDPESVSSARETSAVAVTKMAPDPWEREGSFKWRRVKPSATIHHTNLSSLKPFYLRIRHPHTSLSESSDAPHSTGLTSPPTTPTETGSGFCDPMLEELDAELPVPPPPPRAYPSWLKLALRKQREQAGATASTTVDYSNLPSGCSTTHSQNSSSLGLEQHASCSLENTRYGIRIYPVMQNGVKMSDTHYWLLDAPHSFNSRLRCFSAENDWIPPCDPHTAGEYLNVPAGVHLRREKSEPSPQALNNIHDQMVRRLMEQVPEATRPECQAVLIGTSYRYEEAMKRLKLELLCRLGYLSQSHCKRVLQRTQWDLQHASEQARLIYETRENIRKGHTEPSSPLHTTEDLPSLSSESTSSNVCNILDALQLPTLTTSSDSSSSPGPITAVQPSFLYKSSPNPNDNTNPFLTSQPP